MITKRLALAGAFLWLTVLLVAVVRWDSVPRTGQVRGLLPTGELRVGVDASYPPFASFGADTIQGLDVAIAEGLSRRLNVPLCIVPLGYDGLYDALLTDQVDLVLAGLVMDPSRSQNIQFTLPYFNAGLVLVSDVTDTTLTMPSLAGRSVAVEYGSTAQTEAERWLRRIAPFEVQMHDRPDLALEAAREGSAAAALVDHISARQYLDLHSIWEAEIQDVTVIPIAGALRRDRAVLADLISETFENMLESGEITLLIERWL